MLTLETVKEYLNIDFTDNDDYISSLIWVAFDRAMSITGMAEGGSFNAEIKNAMLEDIAFMYQNRGDASMVNINSISTYRRYSTRPMF
jgi:hypothetical protein